MVAVRIASTKMMGGTTISVKKITTTTSSSGTTTTTETRESTGGTSTADAVVGVSKIRYGMIKTVTNQHIVGAFSSIKATSIGSGYLYFSELPEDHQVGDQYCLRLVQEGSYADNPDVEVGDTVQGYKRRLSADGYTEDGNVSPLQEYVQSFDSLDIVGRQIKFLLPTKLAVQTWAEETAVVYGGVYYSDGHYYKCLASGTTGKIQPTHIKGTVSDGNINWEYLHSGSGVATVVSVPDDHTMVCTVDGYLPILNTTSTTYNWDSYQWSMWGYHNRYPNKVFTFAGRLGYILDTDGYGTWLQMSKTDAYDDFGTEEYGQQVDTCGINSVISGHSDNRINWVLSGYRLYMGSSAGEYNILGDQSTGAITPTNLTILPVSSIGSATDVDAVKYRDMNLFVGASTQELFNLHYDYTTDDYAPDDMGTIGESLLADGVKRMQVLRNKERNLYFLTENNKLRFFNLQEELKVLGTYRVDLQGDVLDMAVSNSGPYSFLFLLIKRGDVATIEVVDSYSPSYMVSRRVITSPDDTTYVSQALQDAEFAGKYIYVKDMTTGKFYHTVPDPEGKFVNRFHTRRIGYGLALNAEIHTVPPFGDKLEGQQQCSVKFTIRLLDSGAFKYGSSNDFGKWYEYNNWSSAAGQEWNASHKLMTGDVQLPSSFGYMQNANKSTGPYPNNTGIGLNLLSETPEPFGLLMVTNVYV